MPAPHSYIRPWYQRLWDSIKPPPAATTTARRTRSPMQRRLLHITGGTVLLLAAGWGLYGYISSAPQRAEARFQEGMRLMSPGTYEQAIKSFDRAVSINPRHAQAFFERGIAKRTLNRPAEALTDFSAALEIDPNLTAAYVARGYIYRERGDVKGAMAEFTRSIGISPTVDALYERGQTYESLGEHQKAVDDFGQAIAIMRDAPYVYRARALVRLKMGDKEGYEEDRKSAVAFEH